MDARRPRIFQAFCVGLPKTGTTSVGTIFENYRSAKIAGSALEQLGCAVRDGTCPEEAVRAFVRRRDADERLEMDPASANWMILGVLKDQFPDAKFILTIRDCYSWCDSMINVVIGREIGNDFLESPALFKSMLGCDLDWFADAETVVSRSEAILDNLLHFWAEQSQLALDCPSGRTLVVRTSEISSSLNAMADFIGVPRDTLLPERSHSRRTSQRFDVLKRLDRGFLENRFAKHADSDVMTKYFPTTTLAGFLSEGPRTGRSGRAPLEVTPGADPGVPTSPRAYPIGYWLNQANAAASSSDRAATERCLAELPTLGLEPDELRRVSTLRSVIQRLDGACRNDAVVSDTPAVTSSDGASTLPDVTALARRREIADVVAVIRAHAARGLPQRFGYRLHHHEIRIEDATVYALIVFASARREFILEVRRRHANEGHWLASERFAISYRRTTPATVQSELQMAQSFLNAIERDVARHDVEEGIHDRE